MKYPYLFNEHTIRNKTVKNRIVFPPVVCFGLLNNKGVVTKRSVEHYQDKARGGAGLIIVEATAVMQDGRLSPEQLGIWSDEFIPGLHEIVSACKPYGTVMLLQIHHGGHRSSPLVTDKLKGPSVVTEDNRTAALSKEEILVVKAAFIEAAKRAKEAGFDGVELHCAHGYLLNAFANSAVNKRTDDYGGCLSNRILLIKEIVEGVRKECGDGFIVGCRLGVLLPALEDGILVAKELESFGIDYMHVSHSGTMDNGPIVPVDFNFNWVVYAGSRVKKYVKIPVIAVNSISTPERAEWLLQNNHADFIALGRDMLTDSHWARKAFINEEINYCLKCLPKCHWYTNGDDCPVRKMQ